MPIELPRRLARFNRTVTNPIQGRYAWFLPPWAVICHRGRRSGRLYRTPVMAFRHGRTLCVVILYGERSDWVQNVLAGEAEVVRVGRTYPLSSPRVATPSDPGALSQASRLLGRISGKLLVAELGAPVEGFGSGPR